MKVSDESNKFVRYGMKVDYSEAVYAGKQHTPFGDPAVFLLEIIEPAGSGWIRPLMSNNQLKEAKPEWDAYLKKLEEVGYRGTLRVQQESTLPPKKIKMVSQTTLASLTFEKRRVPKDSSLYQLCKIKDYFTDDKRTLYVPIEASDENGNLLLLDAVLDDVSYSFWMARLPDDIIGFRYEIDATLEANYMVALDDNEVN